MPTVFDIGEERRQHWLIALSALGYADDLLRDNSEVNELVREGFEILSEAITQVLPQIRREERADGAASILRAIRMRLARLDRELSLKPLHVQIKRAYQTISLVNERLTPREVKTPPETSAE